MELSLSEFEILAQPDDLTCGPTCLQAVYAFHGDETPLTDVIREVPRLENGGTLAVLLGIHALRRGYGATLYSWDLGIFDPTWFQEPVDLAAKLTQQVKAKDNPRLRVATKAYLTFLALGGRVRHGDFEPELLRRYLRVGRPILTGLNSTYLYDCARERDGAPGKMVYDDVAGFQTGHFVVVWRYDPETRLAWLADPLHDNPRTGSHVYSVPIQRLLAAILLGSSTYDANFLVLDAPDKAVQ